MKSNFPSGTVTFLFTDIEGSTKLWENVPEKMKSALNRHHAILHKAIESNGGPFFQIIGDAFCAAFSTAHPQFLPRSTHNAIYMKSNGTCPTLSPMGNPAATNPPGSSGLTYKASSDQYTYSWKTDSAWKGTAGNSS